MGVRWDAVVQNNDFWSERAPQSPEVRAADVKVRICVQVCLFGSLNDGVVESPISLEFYGPFSVRDVIAELGCLYGPAFLDRVANTDGKLLRNCRVFANGHSVEDTAAPIATKASQTVVELILLTAAEGG